MDKLFELLSRELTNLIGLSPYYSATGGSVGSIVLQLFTDEITDADIYSLWSWRYWEIWRRDELLSTSEDDAEPIVGKMARAAASLQHKKIIGFSLYDDFSISIYYEDGLEFSIFTEYEEDQNFVDMENWKLVAKKTHKSFTVDSHVNLLVETLNE